MTDERDRRFRAERLAQARRAVAIQRGTAAELIKLLRAAQARIASILGRTPGEFDRWRMPILREAIRGAVWHLRDAATGQLHLGADRAWAAGIDLVDRPLAAGGIRIAGLLTAIDVQQLVGIKSFLTARMSNASVEMISRINGELSAVVIGVQSSGDAVGKIDRIIDVGGRRRALTLVRTEVGGAYSVAAQARQEQASAFLPGLKKQWRRSGKIHSRPAHDAADGQIRAVNEPYIVDGVKLMFPRDPKAPPAERINCGCHSLPYMDSWTMANPDRQPFSDRELALSPGKRLLASGIG